MVSFTANPEGDLNELRYHKKSFSLLAFLSQTQRSACHLLVARRCVASYTCDPPPARPRPSTCTHDDHHNSHYAIVKTANLRTPPQIDVR